MSFAVADLSAAYARHARRVCRGIAMLERKRILVQDEIEADAAVDVEWTMHTGAAVEITDSAATLSLDGKRFRVRVLEPAGGTWAVEPVNPKPPQSPARNIRKLVLRVRTGEPLTRIALLLSPVATGRELGKPVQLRPLADWSTTFDAP